VPGSIYMDHNATTPTDERVLDAMMPYLTERYGNPSSPYAIADDAADALGAARASVARVLGCEPREIIFTSGGTESDNLALKGVLFAAPCGNRHLVTSAIEHHAVLSTARYLEERFDLDVTCLPVDPSGRVDPDDLGRALRDETVLVSIMHANNETGVIQPIEAIARIARERSVPMHTDAVQSVGKIPVDVARLGVDMLSLSGHKLYGPKGVGALYIRGGLPIDALSHGGGHEFGLRSGTENVAGIIGLAKALELAVAEMDDESSRLRQLAERLEDALLERIPGAFVNGREAERLPGTVSVCFPGAEADGVVLALDLEGVAASSGSACSTGSEAPSHVLLAMGLSPQVAQTSLRLSLGRGNTEGDVLRVLDILPGIVERLRSLAPTRHLTG